MEFRGQQAKQTGAWNHLEARKNVQTTSMNTKRMKLLNAVGMHHLQSFFVSTDVCAGQQFDADWQDKKINLKQRRARENRAWAENETTKKATHTAIHCWRNVHNWKMQSTTNWKKTKRQQNAIHIIFG